MGGSDANRSVASEVNLDTLRLGASNLEFGLDKKSEICAVTLALAGQARHTLLLHTEDLDLAAYDEEQFVDALSRLARSHSNARIWVLIQNARRAVQQGSRLIELSRRLSSYIQFRRPGPEYRNCHESFLLADNSGYLYRPNPGRYEATANFHDPGKVNDWESYFLEVWTRSEPDPEIRRLYL
ncbi:MAG: hypothetical protein OEN52_05750 [Gammaproteobacteria bacterium]|nr:hypothetical protein [Gammaproteobacteria bacterium]MDH3560442.1 hypothetical protein [Gammaproteobacteria bacterium]